MSAAKADKGTILGGTSTTTVTTSNLSNPGSEPTVQTSTSNLTPLQAKQSVSPELTTGIQEMAQPSFRQNIANHPLTAGGATVGTVGTVVCVYAEPCGGGWPSLCSLVVFVKVKKKWLPHPLRFSKRWDFVQPAWISFVFLDIELSGQR